MGASQEWFFYSLWLLKRMDGLTADRLVKGNPHVRLTPQPRIVMLANAFSDDRVMSYRIGGNQVCMDCPEVPVLRSTAHSPAQMVADPRPRKHGSALRWPQGPLFVARLRRHDKTRIWVAPKSKDPMQVVPVGSKARNRCRGDRLAQPPSSGKGGALSSSR